MTLSIILLSVFSVILLSLLVLQYLQHQKSVDSLLQNQAQLMKDQLETHYKSIQTLTDLSEKAQALVASSDPLAYQQVQAMSQTSDFSGYADYDPSDEAEVDRIAERNPNLAAGDDLDAREARQLFAELTGVDPEFYGN